MEKEQYWSVIRFLFLNGKTCEEIKEKLHVVYKDNAPSMTIVRYWYNILSVTEHPFLVKSVPGRPIEVTTEEMVNKIHNIM